MENRLGRKDENVDDSQLKDITKTLKALREEPYRQDGHSRHIDRARLGNGELHLSVESLTTEEGPNRELIADLHPIHRDTLLQHAEIVIKANGMTLPAAEKILPTHGEIVLLSRPGTSES